MPSQIRDLTFINKSFLNTVPTNINLNNLQSNDSARKQFVGNSFSFSALSTVEVLKIIKSIKSNSVGEEKISIRILQLILPYSLMSITSIINNSLSTGQFPQQWKVALIKPIPKKTCVETILDLRPIGLVCWKIR